MTIDPRAMVKRHAAWLVLSAVAVLAIVLALCGAVAHAQGAETAPVVVAYPFDLNALVWGSGGAGMVGGTGLVGWLLFQRFRPLMRRRDADDEGTAPLPTSEVPRPAPAVDAPTRAEHAALVAQIADLKTDVGALTSSVAYNSGTSTRIEARQEALAQTANQIMLLLAGKGGR